MNNASILREILFCSDFKEVGGFSGMNIENRYLLL